MLECKLIIDDEVKCHFEDLHQIHIDYIIKQTKRTVKGAFFTAAVKLGIDDGKESLFGGDGSTFVFMLETVLGLLEPYYDMDVVDNRKEIVFPDHVSADYFDEYDITLRHYQVTATNQIIDNQKGIINIATAGGKSLIAATVAHTYNNDYRTLVIVPSKTLVKQTYKDFISVGLDVGVCHGDVKPKDKEDEWQKRHIVSTWQSLSEQKHNLQNFDVVLYDECHIMGDVMFDLLSTDLAHAPIRAGFTGTVPKDKLKREKVMAHIGGEVISKVKAKDLQDEGYISTIEIDMIPLVHHLELPINSTDWTWEMEEAYMSTNKDRIKTIAEFISLVEKENVLVLCHPQVGKQVADMLDLDFIDKDTKQKDRERFFDEYTKQKEYKLVASFGTSGTGISVNEITYVILIDAGKNETNILQGLGRGLRLDNMDNHLKVADLYSYLIRVNRKDASKMIQYSYSGDKHLAARRRIYKTERYPFTEHKTGITVQ